MDNTTLVAEAVNQSVQNAPSAFAAPVGYAQQVLFPRAFDLLTAPADHPEMLWTLGPMLVAMTLMQIYFGRNRDEELGWNTAFGNSIALIFISVSLLRGLFIFSGESDIFVFFENMVNLENVKIIIIVVLFTYGMLLSLISFYHILPERVAFFMMSAIPINVTAYVGIVLVNSDNVPLDSHTIAAGVVIFLLVFVTSRFVRLIIPQSLNSRINTLKKRKGILETRVKVYHLKARNSKTDERKAKFNYKAAQQKIKAEALQKIIDDLDKER